MFTYLVLIDNIYHRQLILKTIYDSNSSFISSSSHKNNNNNNSNIYLKSNMQSI